MSARPLHVAVVHSYYVSRNPSGENRAVKDQIDALRRAGHRVSEFAANTDDLEGQRLYPLRAALRVATGRGANPLHAIEAVAPDIVHVHNLFPNFGRTWLRRVAAPVVHTMHNYRPVCANALLLRDGRVCTLCADGDRWAGVRHRCYRGSAVATVPVAVANRKGPGGDPLLQRADRIIVLSPAQRRMLLDAGFDLAKVVDGCNFLPEGRRPSASPRSDGERWLYVGRLSEEKGILRLIEHWPSQRRLVVAGDGPLRGRVEEAAHRHGHIELLGAVDRQRVLHEMTLATGLLFPSIWFEGAPLVHLEALAAGLPTVAFEPSAVAASVRTDDTGVVAGWSARAISDALDEVVDRRLAMADRCRAVFAERHTEETFCRDTVALYRSLLGDPE